MLPRLSLDPHQADQLLHVLTILLYHNAPVDPFCFVACSLLHCFQEAIPEVANRLVVALRAECPVCRGVRTHRLQLCSQIVLCTHSHDRTHKLLHGRLRVVAQNHFGIPKHRQHTNHLFNRMLQSFPSFCSKRNCHNILRLRINTDQMSGKWCILAIGLHKHEV